jgi:VanZ family protein
MSVIIFENRRTLNSVKLLFLISLIPLLYGIMMEILQSLLTVTRTGSIYDAIFNAVGILSSILLSICINRFLKPKIK